MHSKVVAKLVTQELSHDPSHTLLLVNEGLGDRLFQLNSHLEQTWPSHVSYLLKNALLCRRAPLITFAGQLSRLVKQVLVSV